MNHQPPSGAAGRPSGRLTSLDAFRGLTIAGMILVNNPGSWGTIYAPLRHAAWDGCTPTDLIFPFFLFIVGVSMAISFRRRAAAGTRAALWGKVIRRTVLIFGIGLFLHGFPRWDAASHGIVAYQLDVLRIPGVLPRIALCYFIVSVLAMTLRPVAQWLVMAGLVAAYLGVLFLLPVPGYGAGVLTLEGNGGSYVDRLLLGARHLYLKDKGFDPEGLVSTLTAAGNTFLGLVFGRILLAAATHRERVLRWLVLGSVLAAVGWGLDGLIPLNKQLWTPSYMLYTAGLAGLVLTGCYLLVEVVGLRRLFQPFVMYGMNAIVIFAGSGVVARILGFIRIGAPPGDISASAGLYQRAQDLLPDPYQASLACALLHVLFFQLAAAVLYRFRIFVKL